MPIDFDAVAAAFSGPLDHELHQLRLIFTRMGDFFDDALKDVEKRERKMHAYPLLDWRGDALTVTLDSSQLGMLALPATPQGTLGARMLDTVTGAAHSFVAGIGWISTAVMQELIIPRTVQIVPQALDAILASLERFPSPSVGMFDPRQRTLSDLFGELGVGFRALAASREAVKRFRDGVEAVQFANVVINPPDASPAAEVPLPERLQVLGGQILDALLILPLVSGLILAELTPAVDAAKLALLQGFAEVEAKGERFRAAAADLILQGVHAGGDAARFVEAAAGILPTYVAFASGFIVLWADQLLTGVRNYLTAVSDWVRNYTRWMAAIVSALDGLMDINLTPFILTVLGAPGFLLKLLPDPPDFTLGQLISTGTDVLTSSPTRWALRQWLGSVALVARTAPFIGDWLARRIDALAEALDILLTPTQTPPEAQLPSMAPFPNIGEGLFGGGRAEAIGNALIEFGEAVRSLVAGTLRTAATAAANLGEVGAEMARRAASIDAPGQFAAVARRAHDQADAAFAGPLAEVRSEMDRQGRDALVDPFEAAVAGGGIQAAAAAIPTYVQEVRRYWEQRQPPTSPHILARHRRIERVRVPRMVIHAGQRSPNAALADEVALRFRAAVGEAYDNGLVRLGATP
jgi:hypothetical protein